MRLKAADRKYLARDGPPDDLEITRSSGPYLFDRRGRKYIDFVSGWNVGNLGWGSRAIRHKVRNTRGPDYVSPNFLYRPWAELAQLLAELAPGDLVKSYRATGGTDAVDIALQVAMAYTGRKKFVALAGSYHGNSIGTVSIASSEGREPYENLLVGCELIAPPLDRKAAQKLEMILKNRQVAAFIMEPICISLGVIVPEKEFMTRLRRLCSRYGTLLIFDEVATGFGRTGTLFASEHFEVAPDIMTMGKAITGGYAGMGAMITTEKIASAVEGDVSFYSTYGWHPISVSAALANLRILRRRLPTLLREVNARSRTISARLSRMKFPPPTTIRVKGLAIAIELPEKRAAEQIVERAKKRRLLLAHDDALVMMFPPLTTDAKTTAVALDILESSL